MIGRAALDFTLAERVVTLVLFGIIAATLALFFEPAFETYGASRSRATLAAGADQAMRRMLQDVRAALPNSIRLPGSQCFEWVPAGAGGRWRRDTDTVNAGAAAVDPSLDISCFDVLPPLARLPVVGDRAVLDNQNPADVYAGSRRSSVTAISTPAAVLGRRCLSIDALQSPLGYDGRFSLVPNARLSQ